MMLDRQDVFGIVPVQRFEHLPLRFPFLLNESLVFDVLRAPIVVRHDKIDVIRSEVEMDFASIDRAVEREADRDLAFDGYDVFGFNLHVQFKSVIPFSFRMKLPADAFAPFRVVLGSRNPTKPLTRARTARTVKRKMFQ